MDRGSPSLREKVLPCHLLYLWTEFLWQVVIQAFIFKDCLTDDSFDQGGLLLCIMPDCLKRVVEVFSNERPVQSEDPLIILDTISPY